MKEIKISQEFKTQTTRAVFWNWYIRGE